VGIFASQNLSLIDFKKISKMCQSLWSKIDIIIHKWQALLVNAQGAMPEVMMVKIILAYFRALDKRKQKKLWPFSQT